MKWLDRRRANKKSVVALTRELGDLKGEHIKLDMLCKQQMGTAFKRLDQMAGTLNNEINMGKQIINFLGDIETKIEAIKTILIRNDIVTEDSYEAVWDEIKGVRVRDGHEVIATGDFAKIDFEVRSKATGALLSKEKDFPIRLGGGALVVEEKIIGTKVKDRLRSFEWTYEKDAPQMAGETVLFNVWVNKVKTNVEPPKGEAHAH